MAITATLSGTILLTDSVLGTAFSKVLSGLAFTGTISEYAQNQLIGTSPVTINLPLSPTQFIYLKNLSTTNTITVTWTPNGSPSAVIQVLQPGGSLLLINTNTTSGITALSLVASGASTPCEYILLG